MEQHRLPLLVADESRLPVHPHHAAVPGDEAAHGAERSAGAAATRELEVPHLGVVRMELAEPEHRIAHPLFLGEPEQALDLRAHVDLAQPTIQRGHEGDGRDLLDERPVARLCHVQERFGGSIVRRRREALHGRG
jgi:hypothetical protein